MTRAFRQSKKWESPANVKRMASVARRGPHFSLYEQAELFAEKEVFGNDGSRWPETQPHKSQCVEENSERGSNEVQKRSHESILIRRPRHLVAGRNFCGVQRSAFRSQPS